MWKLRGTASEWLDRIAKKRAERLGTSIEDARVEYDEPPSAAAAAYLSEHRGRKVVGLLEQSPRAQEARPYPTPECIQPAYLGDYLSGLLPEQVTKHIQRCSGCRTLIATAQPVPGKVQDFLDEVRLIDETLAETAAAASQLAGAQPLARRSPAGQLVRPKRGKARPRGRSKKR